MVEQIIGAIGASIFGLFFLGALLIGLIELLGKVYATYHSLVREDLTTEQILIYLAVIWFIPLGWIIYLLLGKERTSDIFSEVEFL